jgi:anthranilate phosphoribosyltransferase
MMTLPQAIGLVVDRVDLSRQQMTEVMRQIMEGQATDAQIGGFLMAMRMKGETVDEVTAAVTVMRALSTPVHLDLPHLVDTCGTGGDGASLFNVSTAASFIVAASGAHVAKHGNRSASSNSGSADVLEAAGVPLTLTPDEVKHSVETVGLGFMFAKSHHSAMRHAVGARQELKTRTLFNLLGPMTNPANVTHQVIGLFSADVALLMAGVLQNLGSQHVLLVHSDDHLDEISIAADTSVTELKNGNITQYTITPEQFGVARQNLAGLQVTDASASLDLIEGALTGKAGDPWDKARDIMVLNAGAAIYAADITSTLAAGIARARLLIDNGAAHKKYQDFVAYTQAIENKRS